MRLLLLAECAGKSRARWSGAFVAVSHRRPQDRFADAAGVRGTNGVTGIGGRSQCLLVPAQVQAFGR